jgi:pimeloyl-ACP methyl ester carboxylesterase
MKIDKRMVGDVEIACWGNSPEWDQRRKTIVFIHGSGGDHTAWVCQHRQLKNDYNIAALELPGHGSSGGTGEQDVSRYAEWVRAALPAFNITRPVIIGHSLGAAIALTFAIRYGELLRGIVSFGGGGKMPVNPTILEGVQKNPEAILAMTAKIAVAKKNRERLSKVMLERRMDPIVWHGDFLACDRLDITEMFGRIKMPTLIICGTEDKMTPPAYAEVLRDSIPGARLALIPDAGHMAMMEEPEVFNEVLKTFLDGLP